MSAWHQLLVLHSCTRHFLFQNFSRGCSHRWSVVRKRMKIIVHYDSSNPWFTMYDRYSCAKKTYRAICATLSQADMIDIYIEQKCLRVNSSVYNIAVVLLKFKWDSISVWLLFTSIVIHYDRQSRLEINIFSSEPLAPWTIFLLVDRTQSILCINLIQFDYEGIVITYNGHEKIQ